MEMRWETAMACEESVLGTLDHSVGSVWFTITSPSLAACHARDQQGAISTGAAECSGLRSSMEKHQQGRWSKKKGANGS